jgi:hypothetical protein
MRSGNLEIGRKDGIPAFTGMMSQKYDEHYARAYSFDILHKYIGQTHPVQKGEYLSIR